MTVDFFAHCSTVVNATRFGLCDDPPPPHSPAYFQIEEGINWVATVNNPQARNILFTALDHCMDIRRQDNPAKQESLCDCMLTYGDRIVFVELKDRDYPGVLAEAKAQLQNTIRLFSDAHDLRIYKKRFAFFCNKKKPYFPYAQQDEINQFKKQNGVILVPFSTIEIQ